MNMDRTETLKMLAVLKSAYPAFYKDMKSKDADGIVNLWSMMFADEPYVVVESAVMSLIATQTNGFPPTIGVVKEKINQIIESDHMTAQDAWVLASKAAAGNLKWDKLPELVQKAIGSPEVLDSWGMIEEKVFDTVIYSQFIKAYEIYDKRSRETKMIPQSVLGVISGISEKLSLSKGNENLKIIGDGNE